MNRSDFQRLADVRYQEAQALFTAGSFEGAYYLAGYVIECALKACVAKQTREFDFPDKRIVERSYSHNLTQLLEVAGVKSAFEEAGVDDQGLRESWSVVQNWSEASRYTLDVTAKSAQDMLAAVGDEVSGVLPWLKKYW